MKDVLYLWTFCGRTFCGRTLCGRTFCSEGRIVEGRFEVPNEEPTYVLTEWQQVTIGF